MDEIRDFWNRVADDWAIQVGSDGDKNRRLNSDPVLWDFLGDVNGLKVLDAGCGTGYLAAKLSEKGAVVTGVDLSENMLAIARRHSSHLDFRHDSCTSLLTLPDRHFDCLVANYVLMDVPDLQACVDAFYRVLKSSGLAVLVFSHPCFPQGESKFSDGGKAVTYTWEESYFEQQKRVDPPWGHFTSDFIWFHRPLSDYFKAFRRAGFQVLDFEEPRITPDRYQLAETAEELMKAQTRPYSVAFRLQRP